MIQDIHSHTYFSRCGRDEPETIIERAENAGIEVFGICDHNYGIGDRTEEYLSILNALKEKHRGKIKLYRGIEVATVQRTLFLPEGIDASAYDYALMEHIDMESSVYYGDFVGCAKRCNAKRNGIAHTDLFDFSEKTGKDPADFFRSLKDEGIFWEMNVNFDSSHGWREHAYVKRFVSDSRQQDIVRKSGIEISVAFDGHRVEDYSPDRVIKMCRFLEEHNIPLVNLDQ